MNRHAFEDEERIEDRTLVALSKIGLALRGQAWEGTAEHGLNPTQAQILATLDRAPTGVLRLGAIAEVLGVSPPTVSDSVAALRRKGLVSKEPAKDDARALAIRLTPEGRVVAADVLRWPDLLAGAIGVLGAEEQGVMLKALLKVIRELQERGRIAPARTCVTCRYFRPFQHEDEERPHHCAFVDAPFGDRNLRVDCSDHGPAEREAAEAVWRSLIGGAV